VYPGNKHSKILKFYEDSGLQNGKCYDISGKKHSVLFYCFQLMNNLIYACNILYRVNITIRASSIVC